MKSNCDLKATQGRLVVEVIEPKSVTSAGLVLAVPENENLHFGIVVSAGKVPADNHECREAFKEGQTVVWQQYSGVDYKYEGKNYKILNQTDIIAVRETDEDIL